MLAETGADLSAFADAPHFASWAALCPGNNESAGKRKSGRTRKGNRYLRRALVRLDGKVAEVTARLELYMTPHAELVTRMCEVPGVDKLTAWTVLAETGADLSAFADAKYFASWVGAVPGQQRKCR